VTDSERAEESSTDAREERRVVLCLTPVSSTDVLDGALTDEQTLVTVDSVDAVLEHCSELVDCVVVDADFADALAAVERLADRDGPPVVFLVRGSDDATVREAFARGATESLNSEVPGAVAPRLGRVVDQYRRATVPPASDGSADDESLRRDAQFLEQLLGGLMDETGDTIYFKDEDSKFVTVSRSKAREVGVSREEILGMSDFDFMTEDAARERYENEQHIMDSEAPFRDEAERVVTPDGDVRWFQTVKLPRYDQSGEVVGTLGLSRDITELKRLEETLSELERLVDRMPVWLLSIDQTETVSWANDAATDALVGPGRDLVGRTLRELVADGALTERFREQYESTAQQLLSEKGETLKRAVLERVELSLPDGRGGIYNVHVRLLPTAAGRDRGTVVAFHDVTTQVEQERALERQYERLERLVQTVTHDLRNPLTVALGHVEFAHEEYGDGTLEKALTSLKRMDALIDELLSMVEVGQPVENHGSVSLQAIAQEAWQPFADRPATLTVRDDETITADRSRLLRLFENLFRNAVEHGSTSPDSQARQDAVGHSVSDEPSVANTPEDAVERGSRGPRSASTPADAVEHAREDVQVTVEPLPAGGFYVADDGPGVPPAKREQVFEHGHTTAQHGTGFGLTIVDEIASAHGWSIDVTESEDGGARFEIDTDRQ